MNPCGMNAWSYPDSRALMVTKIISTTSPRDPQRATSQALALPTVPVIPLVTDHRLLNLDGKFKRSSGDDSTVEDHPRFSPLKNEPLRKLSDFTIQAILASEESSRITNQTCDNQISSEKLPKRQLSNRGPRIPFTTTQLDTLETKFNQTHYLSSREVNDLSETLQLSESRVKIWFQNRRARFKKKNIACGSHKD